MIFNYITSYLNPVMYYQYSTNNILLNSSKFALLNISSNYHYFPPFIIDGFPSIPSSSVLNLGVTFDANLSLNSHTANISKSANYLNNSPHKKIPN